MSLAWLGRFAEAAGPAAEAIQLAEPTHLPFAVGFAYHTSGMLHLVQGGWVKARSHLEHAITVFRTGNVALTLPISLAACAPVLVYLGETTEAWARIREADQLLERLAARGISPIIARGYLSLGRACLLLGRPDEARRLADRGVDIAPSHSGNAAEARQLLGEISTQPDRFDAERGEAHYRQALALAEPRGMRPLVAHCHLGLGRLYGRTGKREQAREHLATATALYRDMDMTYWLEQAAREEAGTETRSERVAKPSL